MYIVFRKNFEFWPEASVWPVAKTPYSQLESNFSHWKLNSEQYGAFHLTYFRTIHPDNEKHKEDSQGQSAPVSIDIPMI